LALVDFSIYLGVTETIGLVLGVERVGDVLVSIPNLYPAVALCI